MSDFQNLVKEYLERAGWVPSNDPLAPDQKWSKNDKDGYPRSFFLEAALVEQLKVDFAAYGDLEHFAQIIEKGRR